MRGGSEGGKDGDGKLKRRKRRLEDTVTWEGRGMDEEKGEWEGAVI